MARKIQEKSDFIMILLADRSTQGMEAEFVELD